LLTSFSAKDFRNLEPLAWSPSPGTHLLLGGNGAGKTSLLEAIYVLATTRSFRAAQVVDCVRHGQAGFRLAGEVSTDRRATLEVAWSDGVRVRLVNGKATTLAEHLSVLPVVAWTAVEAEVLVGAPRARRRFMDRGLVGAHPAAIEVLGRYREALRQKRQLLAQDATGIEIWNELLAAAAGEVIRRRQAYVEAVSAALAEVITDSGLPLPPLQIRYLPSPPRGLEGPVAIAESLARFAERERRRQQPLVGPHRDELEILWGGHEVRRVASAGERKSLSLLLVAAHGRVLEAAGRTPVYLLDDADAELAPPAVAAVWGVFGGGHCLGGGTRPNQGALKRLEFGAKPRCFK
jgi:DNA replication and repair protein RecF